MATLVTGSITSAAINDVLAVIVSFCTDNGWTADLNTSTRAHIHKGSDHFELAVVSTTIHVVGCTGYNSGNPYNNQPGSGPITAGIINLQSNPLYYRLMSTENMIFCTFYNTTLASIRCIVFGSGINPFGSWTGGQFYSGGTGANGTGWFMNSSAYSYFSVFFNGAWTPLTLANGVNGLLDVNTTLRSRMPSTYNTGILPLPVILYKRDATTTSMFHPLGILPDIMAFSGGDNYADLDTVSIGGSTYTAINVYSGQDPSQDATYLVKLG
jgi:hypothetical protein